jgi:C4-dicarboxylate-specific signal transduction histidine kinase
MSQQPPAAPAATPLERALDQNEAVKDTVEQSAAELLVINAVLKQEVPPHIQTGEVAQALQKTDELEVRIQESAEDLAQINQTLEQEIGERADLERELAKTKAALAKATGQSQARYAAKPLSR